MSSESPTREPLISTTVLDAAISTAPDVVQLHLVSIRQGQEPVAVTGPIAIDPIDWHVTRSGRRVSNGRFETTTPATSTAVRDLWPDAPDRSVTGTITTLEFDRIPEDLEVVLQSWLSASHETGAAFSAFVFPDSIDPEVEVTAWSAAGIYGYLGGSVIAIAIDDGYRSGEVWLKRVEAAVAGGVPSTDLVVRIRADDDSQATDEYGIRRGHVLTCSTGPTTHLDLVTIWPDADARTIASPPEATHIDRTGGELLWDPDEDIPLAASVESIEFPSTPDALEADLVAWLRAARSAGAVLALFVRTNSSVEDLVRPFITGRVDMPQLARVWAFAGGSIVTVDLDCERRSWWEWSHEVNHAAVTAVPLAIDELEHNADESLVALVIRDSTVLQASDEDLYYDWYPTELPLGARLEELGRVYYAYSFGEHDAAEFDRIKDRMHRVRNGECGPRAVDGAGRFFLETGYFD